MSRSSSPSTKRQKIAGSDSPNQFALAIPSSKDSAKPNVIDNTAIQKIPESCLPKDAAERKKLLNMSIDDLKDLVEQAVNERKDREKREEKLIDKVAILQREVEFDEKKAEGRQSYEALMSDLLRKKAYLEGELRSLHDRHARNMSNLDRQMKRDRELCFTNTTSTKMNIVQAKEGLEKLQRAGAAAQEVAKEYEEELLEEGDGVWDE